MKQKLKELNKISNEIEAWQNVDGSIKEEYCSRAHEKLKFIQAIIKSVCHTIEQDKVAEAIAQDIETWISSGLKNSPSFSNTISSFSAPKHGERSFFWGPLRLANAGDRRGYFLRAFISECDEPKELKALSEKFPHPKYICQPTHLLWGSKDIVDGNNVVFFPENIACDSDVTKQDYAIFFFNKHYDLYRNITLQTAHEILPSNTKFSSKEINERETYIARCTWGYLHDYFHHQGERPFDDNIQIKTKRLTGLLEEIKVDMQTYMACRIENFAFSDEVAEFVILERLFRYPQEYDYKSNFDSGTGLLALSYFLQNEGMSIVNGRFNFEVNFDSVVQSLISDIENIEVIENDNAYIVAAEKLVSKYLPINPSTQEFEIPEVILQSPISPYLGRGKIIAGLNNINALKAASKNWVTNNIIENNIYGEELTFRNIYNNSSLDYEIMLTRNDVKIIFGAKIDGQYKKVNPVNDDDLMYAWSQLSQNHPNVKTIEEAEEQRSKLRKVLINSSSDDNLTFD